MNLGQILFVVRARLKDLGVKRWTEAELVASVNEGVSDIAAIFRQAREDYFLTSTVTTIPPAVAPNASEVALPADFLELKELLITTPGMEYITFTAKDRASTSYRQAVIDGGVYASGAGTAYYDIHGNSTITFAPGFDTTMTLRIDYIQTVPELAVPADTPSLIPTEFHSNIVNYAVCEALRTDGDPRLPAYLVRLKEEEESIAEAIQPRQIREPKYVMGYLEEEEW